MEQWESLILAIESENETMACIVLALAFQGLKE